MAQKVNQPVSCTLCGEEYPRDPAYEVACPVCHAAAGKPCMRPSEHTAWSIHPERDGEALRLGFIKKCPKGKSSQSKELALPMEAK